MQDRNGGEDDGPLLAWLAARPASPRAERELVLRLRQALRIEGRGRGGEEERKEER